MSETTAEATESPWVSDHYLILPDASGKQILMLPSPEGWLLPTMHTEGIWLSEAEKLITAARNALDLSFDFTILRYLAIEINEPERWDRLLLLLEPRQPLDQPPLAGQWVDRAQLADLSLALPQQRAALLGYLTENEQGPDSPLIDPRRSPWARPGWFAAAAAWLEDAIAELGYTQNGPVQQLRNWSISALLYVPTSAGILYFKAAAALPLFVNEPALTQSLAHLLPGQVPIPLKIDRNRRWMLMQEFVPTKWESDIELSPLMAAFGALQRASADHIADLFAAGCIDRRPAVLEAQLDLLINDPETRAALTPEEYAALVAMAPELKRRCAAVAASQIPATLIHGDLHLGNITRRPPRAQSASHEAGPSEPGYLFFDWTDACIAFPFLDLFQIYFYGEDESARRRARDAYLENWRGLESPQRLLELWELAKPLCALHHSISYLSIIQSIEPLTGDELYHGFTDYLRFLLASAQ